MINTPNKEELEGLTELEREIIGLAGVLSDNPKLRDIFKEVIPRNEGNDELLSLLLSLSEAKNK